MNRIVILLASLLVVGPVYGETLQLWGGTYVGEVVNGRLHGQGTWTHPDGRKYVGEHKDGTLHGQGTYTWASGNKYIGEFKDGKQHGQGTITWSNGDKYAGEFKDGKRHGQGTITWSNGDKYAGEFKDGNRTGQGTWTRLEKQTTASISGSNTSSSDLVRFYCHESKNNLFYYVVSGGCAVSDIKISKREYTNERLDSSVTATTSTSGSKSVWCATKYGMWGVNKRSACGSATVFSTRYQAEAEHKRLKGTATASTSTSSVWCATKYEVWSTNASCGPGVRVFSNKAKAQAEYQRLKKISTASSNQTPQKTPVQTDSTQNIFWQSIKGSNDADMFQAYLKKFPEGVYAELAEIKIKNLNDPAVANVAIPNLDYGNYHALVIGNNRYRDFTDLNTPINDARTVASILKSKYNFEVNTLENATESEIFKAIVNLRSTVGRSDNVLIYYGGHGDLDNVTEEGFWIPSDAKEDDPSTYLAVDRIRKQIKAMPAKHVMVVADSCFAGSLTRSTLTRALKVKPRSPEYHSELQRISNKKSRTALTSGGLEPVMDSGSDGHSVFAGAFISALEDNDGVLDAHMLFIQVRGHVRNNSPQNPEYSPIYETGHDGGDFLFVRQ
jgi:uncharacterized caspase-like protein